LRLPPATPGTDQTSPLGRSGPRRSDPRRGTTPPTLRVQVPGHVRRAGTRCDHHLDRCGPSVLPGPFARRVVVGGPTGGTHADRCTHRGRTCPAPSLGGGGSTAPGPSALTVVRQIPAPGSVVVRWSGNGPAARRKSRRASYTVRKSRLAHEHHTLPGPAS